LITFNCNKKCEHLTLPLTYLLTPWSRALLEKLIGFQLVKNSPHFMEPEGALLHSQVAATSPYPKPDQSNPCTTILLPEKFILLLSSHLRLGLTGGIFPSSSPPPKKNSVCTSLPIRVTCPYRTFLPDVITRTNIG